MGKSRSYEIVEYRKAIFRKLINSKEIVKLLGFQNVEYPDEVIPWNVMFPHEFIPGTTSETKRYINFEITANLDVRNNTFKNITIIFFVFCHEELIRYMDSDREYLWYDKATCEIDNILSNGIIGLCGNTSLESNTPYVPHNEYRGRMLRFVVKDFTDGNKNGK